eukprot:2468048-Pyramimonas_sp.AAC.1
MSWLKARQIVALGISSDEMVKKLVAAKILSKQFLKDAEFPNDESENYYYVRTALRNTKACIQSETLEASVEQGVDEAGLQALVGDGGILSNEMQVLAGDAASSELFDLTKCMPGTKKQIPSTPADDDEPPE